MQQWHTIADVAKHFGLDAHVTQETLRDELKRRLAQLHPDRNGGEFRSSSEKAEYLQLQSALTFVDDFAQTSTAMVPISQLPAVIEAVTRALTLTQTSPVSTEQIRTTAIQDSRDRISEKFFL